MKKSSFFLGCLLILLSFNSCSNLTTERAKTVELFSRSIEESIEKKCFIGFFDLIANSNSCKINVDIANCWAEEGWKFENVYFSTRQTRLSFDNFFIKIKDYKFNIYQRSENFEVQYKKSKGLTWERAGFIIEPDLGYYLQVEDYQFTDTILVKISSTNDSCEYSLRMQQK